MNETNTSFEEVRSDHIKVLRDGKRIGSLMRNPAWFNANENLWRYWPDECEPTGFFTSIEDAKAAAIEHPAIPTRIPNEVKPAGCEPFEYPWRD